MSSSCYLVFEAGDERLEVCVHHGAGRLLGHVGKQARQEYTRVVEGDVQPTEGLRRGIYHALAVRILRNAGDASTRQTYQISIHDACHPGQHVPGPL